MLELIEFPADDLRRARRFWEGLLGARLEQRTAGEGSGVQTRLGGEVIHPGKRWAICRDSEGSPFGLTIDA